MHGDEQTAKPEQMAASKAEVVQSWYCWTYPSSCPKNQASSTSPVLGRRALANATVVLARAHVLREKAVAARRVVEKLQDTDPEFPFCGSSRQGRIGTSFPGKHERNGVCFFLLRGEGPGDYDMEMQFISLICIKAISLSCRYVSIVSIFTSLHITYVFFHFPRTVPVFLMWMCIYWYCFSCLVPTWQIWQFQGHPSPFDRNFQGVAAMLYAMDVGEKRWHSCWPPRSYRAVGQQWQLHVMLRCKGWLAGVQGSILYS